MPNLADDFHVWGCEVTSTTVKMYFEGELIASYDVAPLGSLDPQNIWLTSISRGDKYTAKGHGPMRPNEHPDTAEFDYVRYYKQKP